MDRYALPQLLSRGAGLGVVNVGAAEPADFPDRYARGLGRLQEMGFRIMEAPHVRQKEGYRSARPEAVANELNALWAREEVDGILCAGGGVTANSLLPYLDYQLFTSKPKLFIGASNPTVLLNAITARSKIVTFHGPGIIWDFGDSDQPAETRDAFERVVRGEIATFGVVPSFLRRGEASGRLLGGNLTSLLHLAGTPWWPDFSESILLWEDIGEDSAHLAAELTHLGELGVFDLITGMIVGELVDCPPSGEVDVKSVVLDTCKDYEFPIGWGLHFGHTPLKATLPIGLEVSVSADDGSIRAVGAFCRSEK
jgi:muramoyltetrapeptide carboxypeptidase